MKPAGECLTLRPISLLARGSGIDHSWPLEGRPDGDFLFEMITTSAVDVVHKTSAILELARLQTCAARMLFGHNH
jgi:hypothetical protein